MDMQSFIINESFMTSHEAQRPPVDEAEITEGKTDDLAKRVEGVEGRNENPADQPEKRIMDTGRNRLEAIKNTWRGFKEGFATRFKGVGKGLETAVVGVLSADVAGEKVLKAGRNEVVRGGRAVKAEVKKDAAWVGQEWKKGEAWAGGEVKKGRDWTVQRANDIYNGGAEAYHRCSDRVHEIQNNFRAALERKRQERQQKRDYNEYQKLLAWRNEMTAKFSRLNELEARFSGRSAE